MLLGPCAIYRCVSFRLNFVGLSWIWLALYGSDRVQNRIVSVNFGNILGLAKVVLGWVDPNRKIRKIKHVYVPM